MNRDGLLHPIAELRGRQIWFEPEKRDWLQWLEAEIKNDRFTHGGAPAVRAFDSFERQAMFSEWVEQEGRHWSDGPADHAVDDQKETSKDSYEDLDPYFAIAIAAAGWHSGALVLVDDDKAHNIREKWVRKVDKEDAGPSVPGAFESIDHDEESYVWTHGGFPRVTLPDGSRMPGAESDHRQWKEGIPTLQELGMQGGPQT